MDEKTGILLLAHGTPEKVEEIPEYLHNVTGGRELPESVVAEISHRYSLIGHSPLTDITREQAQLLSRALELPVYVGMRNWRPYIREAIDDMRGAGIRRAVAICMAPQNSRTSVGLYRKALSPANEEALSFDFVESWSDHPLLIEAFAERLDGALEQVRGEVAEAASVSVVFTAHSVPCRTVQGAEPDPYSREAKETAAAVARACGLSDREWVFAFQSQGASGGTWIGPTVEETLSGLRHEGFSGALLQPIGFLCDHVEVLYDIDIGFTAFARELGMRLWRTESLNTSPRLITTLEQISRAHLGSFHPAVLPAQKTVSSLEHAR